MRNALKLTYSNLEFQKKHSGEGRGRGWKGKEGWGGAPPNENLLLHRCCLLSHFEHFAVTFIVVALTKCMLGVGNTSNTTYCEESEKCQGIVHAEPGEWSSCLLGLLCFGAGAE